MTDQEKRERAAESKRRSRARNPERDREIDRERRKREAVAAAKNPAAPRAVSSIYLGVDRHTAAREAAAALGYESFSDYVCTLLDLGAALSAVAAANLRRAAVLKTVTPAELLASAVAKAAK